MYKLARYPILRLVGIIFLTVPCLAAASSPSTAAKSGTSKPNSPNVILITLDTTRADRMGFLGSDRGLTPNLDALAKDSAVFIRAYSQVPLTPASHATILTGTYPQFHQVSTFGAPLTDDLPYAPAILRARGYHTAAFVGSIVLDPKPPYAPGFERGFDTYGAGFHHERAGEDRHRTVERRGDEVVKRALAWLGSHRNGPFFLWVHLFDAHDPYDPPEPYTTQYASAPYDGAIAYEDAVVGRLLRQLKARGLYDGSVMAVTADHGESLGAHGEDTHGIFLYDETIHVPLLIKFPRAAGAGNRLENRVELVDILPTLLQAAGIAVPEAVQGKSLLSLATIKTATDDTDKAWGERPAYAETDYPKIHGWSGLESWRTGKYLYVEAPRRELYDETADPAADHNLASVSSAVADTLSAQVSAFRRKTANTREAPPMMLDPEAQEKLGALGYMAGSSASSNSNERKQGADPKDKIEIANLIHRAKIYGEAAEFDKAIPLLQQVLAKEPGLSLYGKLGDWLMQQKEYDKAVPVLREAMEMDRDLPAPHLELAKALMKTGDFEGAVPELEITEANMPQLLDAHLFLQMAYTRTNRVPDIIRECKIILQFMPDHYPSYLLLGHYLDVAGDTEGAIQSLKKAAALQPQAPDPHALLAEVYDHLGRKADATRERADAERLAAKSHPNTAARNP